MFPRTFFCLPTGRWVVSAIEPDVVVGEVVAVLVEACGR